VVGLVWGDCFENFFRSFITKIAPPNIRSGVTTLGTKWLRAKVAGSRKRSLLRSEPAAILPTIGNSRCAENNGAAFHGSARSHHKQSCVAPQAVLPLSFGAAGQADGVYDSHRSLDCLSLQGCPKILEALRSFEQNHNRMRTKSNGVRRSDHSMLFER
jgi:hypothetical protein